MKKTKSFPKNNRINKCEICGYTSTNLIDFKYYKNSTFCLKCYKKFKLKPIYKQLTLF